MDRYSGKSVFPGLAFGKLYFLQNAEPEIDESPSKDPGVEWAAFEKAKEQAGKELDALYEKTRENSGEEEADIVDVQRMMLEDGDFLEGVEEAIRKEGHRAAWAVSQTGKKFSEYFASLDDPYMNARSIDIADVSKRVTAILLGTAGRIMLDAPAVIVADDLSPSETLQLDKRFVRAFVTRKGSLTSHTAILARSLRIPSLIQCDIPLEPALQGKAAAVDGHEGKVYVEPNGDLRETLEKRQAADRQAAQALEELRGKPAITLDGRRVELFANIGGVEDMEAALAEDAEGIGLFRSEFLYLGRQDLPGEEEQFEAYRRVIAGMGGRRVIIRTIDIGADKKADYLGLEAEENPALGCRGIRLCFDRPDIFLTQLRAIYRAAAFGKAAIMFPMISSLWELRRCKEAAAQAAEELVRQGSVVGKPELGIMIETPAAALIAVSLAREVDFFSVGTNDLTQYTLAVDRQNEKLAPFMDPHHPAIQRLLGMIVESAHEAGIRAGICGELAADPDLTGTFLKMGYDELSVSPAFILGLRGRIRAMDLS